jgi:membrane fusion protein
MTTDNSLFRKEALSAQRSQWLGTVVLASKPTFKFYALFALLSMVAVGLLLGVGQFSRKVKVNGWLVPQGGMVKIYAQQPGVIGELKVKDGTLVAKGDPLLVLSAERKSSGLGAFSI